MKKYTQFSKRMTIVAVVAAVAVSVLTELLLWHMGNPAGIVEVCKGMLVFAELVFFAYCGNSAVEKWAASRYGRTGSTINENKIENG